jgi:MFS family permease
MIPDLLVSPPARARPSPLAPAATPLPPPEAPPVAEAIEPPARKRFFKKNRKAADILGVISLCLGLGACIMTFLVQLIGGMCCGWLGWPLAIVPIPMAIVTIVLGDLRRHKIMAIIAMVLSVIGVVLAILVLLGLSAAFFGTPYMVTPRHK